MQQFALEATYPLLRSATVRTPISTAFPLLFALANLATLATLAAPGGRGVSRAESPPAFLGGSAAPVPSGGSSNEDLAKKTQNPVADLISVPFQNNFDFGVGPENRMVWDMNIQPVIPFRLNENWNLITRTILPVLHVPPLAPGVDGASGIGDLNPTFFFSPTTPGKFVWGVGPTMTFPTASDRLLGQGNWSAGPAAVGLLMSGPWVVGAIANQQWSFAGWGDRATNKFLVQPFVNYNFPGGWYLASSPIITGDFSASSGNHWVLPLGAGAGKVLRIGALPMNLSLTAYDNVVSPDGGADWQLRFTFSFLFPKG